jgi:hypothetical protein
MQREIKVGTVSWIIDEPNPMYTTLQTKMLSPGWIPKTYLGLSATANPAPPDPLTDFTAYQKNRDFRAMTFCRFRVELDDDTGRVSSFSVVDAFHDGGWTPPFRMRNWPSTAVAFDWDIYSDTWYQGESSPLSVVATQNRHRCTAIGAAPPEETVLVNALIKFRAGKHTDDTGIKTVGCPFHVPWVWCELLLTYQGGRFRMYGRGSIFPSHAWYFNDKRIKVVAQTGDRFFPTKYLTIAEHSLNLYPVLSAGASASGPQQSLSDETSRTGPVEGHPNTAKGSSEWSQWL